MDLDKEIELTSGEDTEYNDSEISPLKSSCSKTLDSTYDGLLTTLREVSSECIPEGGFSCDILKYLRKWEVSFSATYLSVTILMSISHALMF
jgi:hypothetical protein